MICKSSVNKFTSCVPPPSLSIVKDETNPDNPEPSPTNEPLNDPVNWFALSVPNEVAILAVVTAPSAN